MENITIWQDLHLDEARKLDRDKVIIIPCGAIEPHGDHLPLKADIAAPELIAREVCKRTNSILGVSLPVGWSEELMGFPGALTLSSATYIGLVEDHIDSYYRHGFRRFVLINGHGGNPPYIKVALANLVKRYGDIKIKLCDWYDEEFRGELGGKGRHAHKAEVEMLMLADPKSVRMDKARDYEATWLKCWHKDLTKVIPYCVDGEPTKANEKDAKILLDRVATKISEIVETIKLYK